MKTKFVATNMDRKKSLLAELMKNMLTRINQQILTCIQNKEGIRSDLIFPFFNAHKRSLSKLYLQPWTCMSKMRNTRISSLCLPLLVGLNAQHKNLKKLLQFQSMFRSTSYGHKETKIKLGPTDFLISLARLCHFNYTNSCNYGAY